MSGLPSTASYGRSSTCQSATAYGVDALRVCVPGVRCATPGYHLGRPSASGARCPVCHRRRPTGDRRLANLRRPTASMRFGFAFRGCAARPPGYHLGRLRRPVRLGLCTALRDTRLPSRTAFGVRRAWVCVQGALRDTRLTFRTPSASGARCQRRLRKIMAHTYSKFWSSILLTSIESGSSKVDAF